MKKENQKESKKGDKIFIIIALISIIIIALLIIKILDYENIDYEKIMIKDHEKSLFCINTFNESQRDAEFIITNQEEYEKLNQLINQNFCENFILPEIDFSKYSILGAYTGIPACNIDFERQVMKNDILKKIVYRIEIDYQGKCESLLMNMNWILIEKIPEGYKTEIKIIKN